MGIVDYFKKQEFLTAVDIGSTSVKIAEFDFSGDEPVLTNLAVQKFDMEVFGSNAIDKKDHVADKLASVIEQNEIGLRRVVTAVPAPNVFTKKITMSKAAPDALAASVQFEAANFIPHNIEAVKLDYFVLGEHSKSQYEVLVVAAKNEIVDSYLDCLALTGLEVAIVDVDYFALGNCFERAYPEYDDKNVVLLDIGARCTSINILSHTKSVFTGDISVGGNVYTQAIMEHLECKRPEAEALKGRLQEADTYAKVASVIEEKNEYIADEINRQLSLFWNSSGVEEGIDELFVTGGASRTRGLIEEIRSKTGVTCNELDPYKEAKISSDIDTMLLDEFRPFVTVALGMAERQPGDKEFPEESDE